jgi:uncharacterized protein (TIGR02145 family)
MFTGFIKCDCNGVCIEVNPFICTTTSSSTTTTTTTAACNRFGYFYDIFNCVTCEYVDFNFLYNSNPLTLFTFYQYGDLVISPYQYTGCDVGVSDASIPSIGFSTCEEVDCGTTTTTTTRKPIDCKRYVVSATVVAPATGSWTALDCLGEPISGVTTEFNSITPCIDIDTFVPIDTLIKQTIDCNVLICQEYQLQATGVDASWSALNCLGENVGGIVPGDGTTIPTGCIDSNTLITINAGIKSITECVTPTTTTTTTCPNCIQDTTVVIDTQTWDKCNLNVTTYRDNTPIPQVQDPTAWANLTTGAWCHYDNDPANDAIYGKLYNWYAVNDSRGLAPVGKKIPTDAEWTVLTDFLGGESIAGGKMKETGFCHWADPNTDATNSSGFTALPGGLRDYFFGEFDGISVLGSWWSSSEYDTANAWSRNLNYDDGIAYSYYTIKGSGFSVRCIEE